LAQDLPELIDTLPAPCGIRVEYSHAPNGNADAIGFLLVSDVYTCLPIKITLRHYAYVVKDKIQVYFLDEDGDWHLWYDSGWHRRMEEKVLIIPDWVVNVMFVGSNNLDSGTAWWFELDCEYPPLEECCWIVVELTGPTDTFCPDAIVDVTAHVLKGNPPYQYFWGGSPAGDSVVSGLAGQLFQVTVVDSIGCEGRVFFRANTYKSPISVPAKLVCPGSWVIIPQMPGLIWQFSDTLVFVRKDTTLWGITMDTLGCEYNVALRIRVQQRPIVSPDTVICRNRPVRLQTSGETFSWQNSSGQELSDQSALVVKASTDSTFFVTVTDSLGCVWKDTVQIDARYCLDDVNMYLPNVVMPEGSLDPLNSTWKIFLDPKAWGDVQVVRLRIWDRWGNLAHEAENLEVVWDGVYANDMPAPAGVYIWQAYIQTLEGTTILAGDITVIR